MYYCERSFFLSTTNRDPVLSTFLAALLFIFELLLSLSILERGDLINASGIVLDCTSLYGRKYLDFSFIRSILRIGRDGNLMDID